MLSGRSLCDGLITRPEESYRLSCVVVCDLETTWIRWSWPTVGGGCHASIKQTNKQTNWQTGGRTDWRVLRLAPLQISIRSVNKAFPLHYASSSLIMLPSNETFHSCFPSSPNPFCFSIDSCRRPLRSCSTAGKVKQSHYRPWQALRVPRGRGSQILRQSAHEDKFVNPSQRPPLPQKIFLVLISVRGWVYPRTIVRSKRWYQWKFLMTQSGIDPATFRFVSQCLKHCATVCPPFNWR
jgi:hypothetical protein